MGHSSKEFKLIPHMNGLASQIIFDSDSSCRSLPYGC